MTRQTPEPAVEDEESGCGWEWDHTVRVLYEGPEGTQWECTECGAEGWDEPEANAAESQKGSDHRCASTSPPPLP
jgi:hypothetical protein